MARRNRPKPARRVAPKPPDVEPSLFLFRFYEAGARDLTHPARDVTGDMRLLGELKLITLLLNRPLIQSVLKHMGLERHPSPKTLRDSVLHLAD